MFNSPGVHVLDVAWREAVKRTPAGLGLVVETGSAGTGCPGCGVIAEARGRRVRRLHDIPAFAALVQLVWRQRRYRCVEPACLVGGFSEDHELAVPRGKLTVRAAWWAISCIQRDTASVASVARRLGVDWHTRVGRDRRTWQMTLSVSRELRSSGSTSTSGTTRHVRGRAPRS